MKTQPALDGSVLEMLRATLGMLALAPFATAQVGRFDPSASALPAPRLSAELHVARVLRDSRLAEAPPLEELAARLVEPGTASVVPMLSILAERRVPRTGLEPEEDQILSLPQREMVLTGLARFDRKTVLAALDEHLAETYFELAAIGVLGAVGDARDLVRIVDLAPKEVGEEGERAVAEAFGRVLRRDERALAEAVELYRRVPHALREALVIAVGAAGDPRALAFLERVIAREPELAPLAVAQIRLVGRSANLEVNADLARTLRGRITGPEPCRASILGIGELADAHSIARLIDLLADERRGVRENAHWALRRITGQKFPPTHDVWTRWYAREREWFERQLARAARDLRSPHRGTVATAIAAIAARPIHRDELATELLVVLDRQEPDLRELACDALARLGSSVAVEPLVRARADTNHAVATAAAAALAELRRKGLPRDAPTWDDGASALGG